MHIIKRGSIIRYTANDQGYLFSNAYTAAYNVYGGLLSREFYAKTLRKYVNQVFSRNPLNYHPLTIKG